MQSNIVSVFLLIVVCSSGGYLLRQKDNINAGFRF